MESPTLTSLVSPLSEPLNNGNDPTMETTQILNLNPSPSSKRKKSPHHPKPKSRKGKRRRLEKEKEISLTDEENDGVGGRPRKRREKGKQQLHAKVLGEGAEENALCLVATYRKLDGKVGSANGDNNVWEAISELVMWKNVAKSALWFGSGSIFFLSSCFSRDSNFSIISAASHLGILVLGTAFFHDSLPRWRQKPRSGRFQLTEDDFLRVARLILPTTNSVLAKCQEIFSGEPLMTLKVAPILLLAAKYGHLITPWRLLATGFFLSFTLPKLCSSYSVIIQQRVEEVKSYIKEAWKACPRKKLVAISTAMLFWNMVSVKMRIFAAFMSIAALRHNKQQRTRCVCNEIDSGIEQQRLMFAER